MADRTLTINHADGGSETYTINRDKFAGVRSMSVDGNPVTVDRTAVPKPITKETTIYASPAKDIDPSGETVILYGIAGQSNAGGRADVAEAGTRFDALNALTNRAFIYNTGNTSFEEFEFGVNHNLTISNIADFGPESELLRIATKHTESKIYVVKRSVGSTSLYSDWDSEAGGNLYNDFVNDYVAAVSLLEGQGYNIEHRGVLFAQGERDSQNDLGGGVASYYEDKQLKFIQNLRTDLSQSNLPVCLTLIMSPNSAYTHKDEVNQAKINVSNTLEGVATIDASSFEFDVDDIHYNGSGQISHGEAFYNTVSALNGVGVYHLNRDVEPLLANVVGGSAIAYSLQDLNDKQGDTKVVRVRRSSDSSEADFKANEIKNLVSWVGEGNEGFVVTWYDQSGNERHAEQLTESRQPKIVTNGALVSGGIYFDGASNNRGYGLNLNANALESLRNVGYSTFHIVTASAQTGTGGARVIEISRGTSTSPRVLIGDSSDSSGCFRLGGRRLDGDSFSFTNSDTPHNNEQVLLSAIIRWQEASTTLYQNGVKVAEDTNFHTAGNTSNTSSHPTNSRVGGLGYEGQIASLIVYNTNEEPNREAIEANINNQYDIY